MDVEQVADITVVDVYESASSIGKEFERIIEFYGTDSVTELMPKVIYVLEQLEALAQKNERENDQINELQLSVQRLEAEKSERNVERLKYEAELEQIEESWKSETAELMQTIQLLQEENKKLSSDLALKEGSNQMSCSMTDSMLADTDFAMVAKLKETIDKQREQLRSSDRSLSQKNVDLDGLESQVEVLTKVCRDLRRKNRLIQKHGRMAVEEKAELQTQLQDKNQQIKRLKQKLGFSDKEGMVATPDLEGKLVIDVNDPDRPRFTLNELRQILWERNELKSKLMELEEELEQFRPCSLSDDMYEGDAQGPINKEPDEKLYPMKYQKSGIKRFFRFFFGDESPFSSARSSPVHQRAAKQSGVRSSSPDPKRASRAESPDTKSLGSASPSPDKTSKPFNAKTTTTKANSASKVTHEQ